MSNKRGGDVTQQSAGGQFNHSNTPARAVAEAGFSIDDTLGGTSYVDQSVVQAMIQSLRQSQFGLAGHGGEDNTSTSDHIAYL